MRIRPCIMHVSIQHSSEDKHQGLYFRIALVFVVKRQAYVDEACSFDVPRQQLSFLILGFRDFDNGSFRIRWDSQNCVI